MGNKHTDIQAQVKFPLGVKLAIIIGTIVLVSLGCVTFLNSHFIGQDVKITAENNNLTINSRSAGTVDDRLSTVRSNVFQLLDLMNVVSGGRSSSLARQAEAFFFERNQDIAAVNILTGEDFKSSARSAKESSIINNRFFISNEIDVSSLENFIEASTQQINRSCMGETIALNASPFFNIPVMALFFPWKENGLDQTCVITFSIENMLDILGTDSVNTTFILNDSAELLCHPDTAKVLIGESYKNYPLVAAMLRNNESNSDSRQIPFSVIDENKKKTDYFGAYQKLSIGDITVLTTVPVDSILEGVRTTRKNNIYLTGIVFFLSVIIILVFTRQGISRHLRKLTEAAEEIKNGNFDTPVFDELSTKRRDEIGVLNQSTKDEREFLVFLQSLQTKALQKALPEKNLTLTRILRI